MLRTIGASVLPGLALNLFVGMPVAAQILEQGAETPSQPAAYLNTETGQVTLKKAEGSGVIPLTKELLNAMRTDSDGLTVETISSGAQRLDLKGRRQHVVFGKIGPDGTVLTECTSGLGATGVEAAAKAFEAREAARTAAGD